jgi:chemotaxis protein CheD
MSPSTEIVKPSSKPQDAGAQVLPEAYLHPGELYASPVPANVKIIVGSCVAVCIYDPRLKIGGATHYLLPTLGNGKSSLRYGDVAIATLLRELRKCGSRKRDLQVHLYGGACVLSAFSSGAREPIGQQNIRIAIDVLSREAIPVILWETGGTKGRKIVMRTDCGEITCSLIGG